MMIPKTIHYCWFGGKPLPPLALKCIASWERHLPGYEIRRWDESNFDISLLPYAAGAYAAGKYAFVSDVARYWILYHHGGVYFDTDVEVIAPLDDILDRGPFMGRELPYDPALPPERLGVAPGLGIAAEAGHPFYRDMLDIYARLRFDPKLKNDSQPTIVDITTRELARRGLVNTPGIQSVEGIDIYPSEYFNPLLYDTKELVITPLTRSIHYGSASWMSPWRRFKFRLQRLIGSRPTRLIQRLKRAVTRK